MVMVLTRSALIVTIAIWARHLMIYLHYIIIIFLSIKQMIIIYTTTTITQKKDIHNEFMPPTGFDPVTFRL
jgi:hypothetical protein